MAGLNCLRPRSQTIRRCLEAVEQDVTVVLELFGNNVEVIPEFIANCFQVLLRRICFQVLLRREGLELFSKVVFRDERMKLFSKIVFCDERLKLFSKLAAGHWSIKVRHIVRRKRHSVRVCTDRSCPVHPAIQRVAGIATQILPDGGLPSVAGISSGGDDDAIVAR